MLKADNSVGETHTVYVYLEQETALLNQHKKGTVLVAYYYYFYFTAWRMYSPLALLTCATFLRKHVFLSAAPEDGCQWNFIGIIAPHQAMKDAAYCTSS